MPMYSVLTDKAFMRIVMLIPSIRRTGPTNTQMTFPSVDIQQKSSLVKFTWNFIPATVTMTAGNTQPIIRYTVGENIYIW